MTKEKELMRKLLKENERIEKEKRRMGFLEEDKEMFGLTPNEEIELKKLQNKYKK